jgi:hypothetical protein
MSTEPTNPRPRLGWALALVASGVVAGGIVAATLPAGAQSTPSPSATAPGRTADGTHRQRAGATLLTGANAAKAKAAALKAVPGATVERVETDADGGAYEAHVVKPDGTRATVKMDKSFAVTGVQICDRGAGHGGPSSTTGSSGTTGTGTTGTGTTSSNSADA